MDATWLQSRIDATKTQIESMETAIAAIVTGAASSWSLDTGQTKETVTKKNVAVYQAAVDVLYNRLEVLEARRDGAAGQARPGW